MAGFNFFFYEFHLEENWVPITEGNCQAMFFNVCNFIVEEKFAVITQISYYFRARKLSHMHL